MKKARESTTKRPPYQLLPPLDQEQFELLKEDIRQRGVLVPIERDENGELLDGHHRMRAVEELRQEGVVCDPPVILRLDMSEVEKKAHVRALNLHRRHLTRAQRRAVIEDQLRESPDRSDRWIAKSLAVAPSTVGMVRRRLGERGSTVRIEQSKRTGLDGRRRAAPKPRSVVAASGVEAKRALAALKDLPPGTMPDRLLSVSDTTIAARLVRRESSREARLERLRDPGQLSDHRDQKYSVLYLDPPWQYQGASDPGRTAERHYPTLAKEELLLLPVGEIAAADAVMFMWVTPPKIAEATELMMAWGFEYKTCACWDKGGERGTQAGMGSYYRQQHELLFVGTRGNMPPPAPANRPPSILRAPRGRHSAKPDIARQQIEAMYGDGIPRIELFARGPVPNWSVWGFEAETGEVEEKREA